MPADADARALAVRHRPVHADHGSRRPLEPERERARLTASASNPRRTSTSAPFSDTSRSRAGAMPRRARRARRGRGTGCARTAAARVRPPCYLRAGRDGSPPRIARPCRAQRGRAGRARPPGRTWAPVTITGREARLRERLEDRRARRRQGSWSAFRDDGRREDLAGAGVSRPRGAAEPGPPEELERGAVTGSGSAPESANRMTSTWPVVTNLRRSVPTDEVPEGDRERVRRM